MLLRREVSLMLLQRGLADAALKRGPVESLMPLCREVHLLYADIEVETQPDWSMAN